jgi:hypothetical protein
LGSLSTARSHEHLVFGVRGAPDEKAAVAALDRLSQAVAAFPRDALANAGAEARREPVGTAPDVEAYEAADE